MTSAAVSIKAFGVYAFLTGLNLLLAPNFVFSLLGIPPTNDVWIRVVGVLAVVIGYYYWVCGSANARAFFKATINGRIAGFLLPLLLIALFSAPWQLALFAVVDLAGAAWTLAAMHAEAKASTVGA